MRNKKHHHRCCYAVRSIFPKGECNCKPNPDLRENQTVRYHAGLATVWRLYKHTAIITFRGQSRHVMQSELEIMKPKVPMITGYTRIIDDLMTEADRFIAGGL